MIRKLKPGEMIRKKRAPQPSRFERTEEWRVLKKALDNGLKPNEAYLVTLTPDEKKRYHIKSKRTVVRCIQQYLRDHKMPYTLATFNREEGDTFVVKYEPVLSKTA
jgi:hypothetical protein